MLSNKNSSRFRNTLIGLATFILLSANSSPSHARGKDGASLIRGGIVFRTYCVLCHGETGKGNGRLAIGKMPPPADLTKSMLSDSQKEAIIRGGGESVGRSPFMPPWGQELSDEQIKDLITFLRAINE